MHFSQFCITFMLIAVSSGTSKYSKHDNEHQGNKQFQMGKINTLWQKAQKLLKGQRLADLHADLTVQDRKEKAIKQARQDGIDEDGLLEAGVNRDYLDILHNYDLEGYFSTEHIQRHGDPTLPGSKSAGDRELRDDKLKKLWKTAKSVGFTDEEMSTLKEEFSHHQMKLDELHALKLEFEQLEALVQVDNSLENPYVTGEMGLMTSLTSVEPDQPDHAEVDNSLEAQDGQDSVWLDLQKRRRDMKIKHKLLSDEYRMLESKTLEDVKIQPLFQDDRVLQLWSLARKTNMTVDELDSFKKELKHFDHRIDKHEYLQGEMKKSADKLSTNPHHREDHEELQDKVKHYGSKVNKYHTDLKQKVDRRLKHTEL